MKDDHRSCARANNELTTAVSYFALYQTLSVPTSRKVAVAAEENNTVVPLVVPATNELEKKETDDFEFWAEDEWSESDSRAAESLLNQHLEKCDIRSAAAPRAQHLIQKFESNAGSFWDTFYTHNGTGFFKDRHYLGRAFPLEFSLLYHHNAHETDAANTSNRHPANDSGTHVSQNHERKENHDFTIVEIGSGVGNAILPLLERSDYCRTQHDRRLVVYGFDFSHVAVSLMQQDERYIAAGKGALSSVWDITEVHAKDVVVQQAQTGVAHVAMLLFCLSAVSPEHMVVAARNVARTLRPGGILVFRDYGRFDEAQLKLGTSRRKRLGDNFYVKSDGTRCYYFDLDDLKRLFGPDEGGAGLEVMELQYIRRVYQNRGSDVSRRRVWVQARFRKPLA
eukprot:scaffold129257_cov54-Attheya_sp.AAC.6